MLADYRLACYPRPLGSATAYTIGNTFSTSDLRLRRLGGRIRWPKLREDNEFYEHLNIQKDRLNESMQFDFDKIETEEEKIDRYRSKYRLSYSIRNSARLHCNLSPAATKE